MKENRKGFILPLKEVNNIADIEAPDKVMVLNDKGQPRMVKRKNDNELLDIYPFLRPIVTFVKQQPEPSIHLKISLEILQPLGCLEEHYREPTANEPLFDVACYVLSGRVRAKIGDIEKTVGPDTLIYCPSNIKCSIANVGKGQAKYLAICALAEGKKFGEPIYSKMPTWRI